MLALNLYRSQVMSCGHYRPQATDPEAEYAWTVEPERCHICTTILMARDAQKHTPHPEALHYYPERR